MANIFIISAPSGSGKSTLVSRVRRSLPNLEFSISYTTRSPRGAEQDGREYFFVSRKEFEDMIRKGEFLEHADVFGNYYGTSRSFLSKAEQQGKDLLLDIDVQGARQIKANYADAVSIFVLPPSWQELEGRLRGRATEGEEVISRRLQRAREEVNDHGVGFRRDKEAKRILNCIERFWERKRPVAD